MSTIISTTHLGQLLKGTLDNTTATAVVEAATSFVNTNALRYHPFDTIADDGTTQAPAIIVMYCKEIAKTMYLQAIGQTKRDGNETEDLQDVLDYYQDKLRDTKFQIEPAIIAKTISLNSNGSMLIARGQEILTYHPLCRVESADSPQNEWNQDEHWHIRRGTTDDESEFSDGWYFDAETYKDDIEGTLYYARSFRNDGWDRIRFNPAGYV